MRRPKSERRTLRMASKSTPLMTIDRNGEFDPLGSLVMELNGYAHLSRNWDGRGAAPFELPLIFEVLRLSETILDCCRKHESRATRIASHPHPDGSIEVEFFRAERAISLRLHSNLQLDIQYRGGGAPPDILVYSEGLSLVVEAAGAWLCGLRIATG